MNRSSIMGIISVILGLMIIIFPLTGYLALDLIFSISIVFLGIYSIIAGASVKNWVNIILGALFLILGIMMIYNPGALAFFTAFTNYFVGIVLIVFSIFNLFMGGENKYASIAGLIFGILSIVIGYLCLSPLFIGILMGLWFIMSGISKFVEPDFKE